MGYVGHGMEDENTGKEEEEEYVIIPVMQPEIEALLKVVSMLNTQTILQRSLRQV